LAEAAIAESVAAEQPVHYLATGQVTDYDPAWWQRVAEHRDRRPPHWSTLETDDIATQLRRSPGTPTLVDDIGGWLTAALDRRQAWERGSVSVDVDDLLAAVAEFGSPWCPPPPRPGGSPTSWARSTSSWPCSATAWCW
jgi:adenosylcobinamide kinase/adenosylcobinamide-phosphate guanylyltransferase